ncbi:MAG: hypothetical protein Q9221_002789 [Calogaya cf. arnoldii]
MDLNTDSRTASFSLKRPHPDASRSENSGPSLSTTPRKRVRVDDNNGQNGEEPASSKDTTDTVNISPDGQEFSIKGCAAEHEAHDSAFSQSIPSMNWNTGSKTKIRVSLKGRAAETKAASTPIDNATATKPAATEGTEQQTVAQLPAEVGVSEILANSPKKVKKQCDALLAQGRVPVAEGRRLFIGNLEFSATKGDIRDLFQGYSIAAVTVPNHPRTSRPLGYAFIDLSTSEQALQAVSQLSGKAVVGRNVLVQLVSDKKSETDPEQKRIRRQSRRDLEAKQSGKESGLEHTSNETAVILDVNRSEASSVQFPTKPPTSGPYKEGSTYLFELPPRLNSSEKEAIDTDTGEGVILNIQNDSEQESGEITDSDSSEKKTEQRTFDGAAEIELGSRNSGSDSDDREIHLAHDDAMMAYADSGASNGNISHRYYTSTGLTKASQSQILAHLQQEELKLQLRYFYVAKTSQEVDLNDPVRCLVCAEKGHMADVCGQLDCTRCGEQKTHSTRNCPLILLPSGAKRSQTTVCELCKRHGHLPDECELFWRTAGGPWDSDLSDMKIRFECYGCGKRGHLGNDCSFRRPGKPPGSSSWTYHRQKGAASKSNQGISIKGRAQQQESPIVIDDSDEDLSNFRRPKVAAPAGPGQINIKMGGRRNKDTYPHNPSNNRIRDYDYAQDAGHDNYGVRRRRSASPRGAEYGNGNFDYNDSSARHPLSYGRPNLQPPLPPEPPPHSHGDPPGLSGNRGSRGGGNVRPMPSAGRQAWMQFRK